MTDKKWSELSTTTPQDSDDVALRRGNDNFRWSFQSLRTWLEGFFATDAELSSHTGAANPHSGSASQASLDTHTSAANPHSGSASDADVTNAVNAHDASGSAHGGVEAAFGAHDGATGAAHGVATGVANGFMASDDKTKLDGVEGSANNYSHPNHTGDVTSVGDGAQTIAADAVTNAKLANMAANTLKMRVTTPGDPTDSTIEALSDEPSPAGTESLLAQKAGGDLIKIAVSNLPTGGGGEVNVSTTPATVGANEADINMAKVGADLQKRKLVGGTNVTLTQDADAITIEAAGGGGSGDVEQGGTGDDAELTTWLDWSAKTVQGAGFAASDVARLGTANTFTADQTIAKADPTVDLHDTTGLTPDSRRTRIYQTDNALTVRATTDAGGFPNDSIMARFMHADGFVVGGPLATQQGHGTIVAESGLFEWHNSEPVNVLYPIDKAEAGATVNLTLAASPRVVCTSTGASITVNAPTSGEGSLEVVIESGTPTVSPTGFTEVAGSDSGNAMRTAYVTRTAGGSTKWAWGP